MPQRFAHTNTNNNDDHNIIILAIFASQNNKEYSFQHRKKIQQYVGDERTIITYSTITAIRALGLK